MIMMLILKYILVLQSLIIDLTNSFSQENIPSGEPVFIELPRYLKSDGGKCDVVLRSSKSVYFQDESTRLWYKIY